MHAITAEILERYQVRKTKAQKAAFRAFLRPQLEAAGYTVREETSRGLGSVNVVVGDVASAEVLFAAHYDTCAVLPVPNFIAPRNWVLSLLYQLLLAAGILAALLGGMLLVRFVTQSLLLRQILRLGILALVLGLFFFGPANRHTANDNTSGVAVLVEALLTLPPQARHRAAFVFFDHEELGLVGSSYFRKLHRQDMQDKPLINFDCVSDGDEFLLVFNRRFRADAALVGRVKAALMLPRGKTGVFSAAGRTLYPSDQVGFPKAAGVVALRRAPLVGAYLSRIHTPRDTVFDEANIEAMRAFAVRLAGE